MDCVTTGSDLAASSRRRSRKTTQAKGVRATKSDARSGSIEGAAWAAEFSSFEAEVRRELAPRGLLESLAAGNVARAAWQFQEAVDRKAVRRPRGPHDPDLEASRGRSLTRLDRATRSLRESLELLDYARARRKPRLDAATPVLAEVEPNEWPVVPTDGLDDFPGDPGPIEQPTPNWRDRLVFDFEVSDVSPVVQGTWVTVAHVVSLIVDGWTWADILRSHPELSEIDIRTCVAYAMVEEDSAD